MWLRSLICALSAPILFATPQKSHTPPTPKTTPTPPPTLAPEPIPDDTSSVAVLGYHDFDEKKPQTEMRMHTSQFRAQMETIKQSRIPVISLNDFLDWKAGKKSLPPQSILLTFDDGWLAVYTDAFPILKEYNFPFTLFLYKNYIAVNGRSMSINMIKEMMQHSATLGCHSTSHPYPATVKSQAKKSPPSFDQFLRTQFGESKRFLESTFKQPITTYAYPGGYHREEMYPIATEFGYTALFTVIPQKVTRSTNHFAIPRYMILGNAPSIFKLALDFSPQKNTQSTSTKNHTAPTTPILPPPPIPVFPTPNSQVPELALPTISAELASIPNLDPTTLTLKISGFGIVPASYNPTHQVLSWQINRPLRSQKYTISLDAKTLDKKNIPTITWSFTTTTTTLKKPQATKISPNPSIPTPATTTPNH